MNEKKSPIPTWNQPPTIPTTFLNPGSPRGHGSQSTRRSSRAKRPVSFLGTLAHVAPSSEGHGTVDTVLCAASDFPTIGNFFRSELLPNTFQNSPFTEEKEGVHKEAGC